MTCLPERDSFSWCGTLDNYSGVFLNKINKIWQSPLINSWDCVSYFWQSPNTYAISAESIPGSSSPILPSACFTSRLLIPMYTCFVLRRSILLRCRVLNFQWKTEKFTSLMKAVSAKIHFRGISENILSSLPVTQG